MDDYFSNNFDESKNCVQEDLMEKLGKDDEHERCAIKSQGSLEKQWEQCKSDLVAKLAQRCNPRKIVKTGDFLYCRNRGRTSCCFNKEKCSQNMTVANDEMYDKALKYMSNPKKHLKKLVKDLGYETCHQIEGYDATQCQKDCDKLEKSEFAKDCAKKHKGVFKCCIRRDKEFCHECRFCCTLSVCTNNTGNHFKDTTQEELGAVKNEKISGKAAFEVDMKMYKGPDYRCLKPLKGVAPESWPHHFMPEYRAAKERFNYKDLKFHFLSL